MSVRVFIADDHEVLVDGLKLMLEGNADLRVVGTAADGVEAVRAIEALRPDVVLMDITMPQMNGISALKELRRVASGVRVIVLTMHGTREHVRGALHAGAQGFVLKESAGREVVEAVRRVAAGRRYLGRGVIDLVAGDLAGSGQGDDGGDPFTALSRREMQVLQHLGEGLAPKQIAALLGISPKTVDTYRRRLMGKLGVHNLASLVKLAVRAGITSE